MDRFTRHPLPDTLRIAIVGLGLLGGSVAQGLRASGFSGRIAGHDLQDATLQAALSAGVIDEGAGDPRQLFMDFDLVVLCQPVDALLQFLARHRDGLAAGSATVLDVASVKAPVAAAIAGTPAEQRMVPCHPIAGREVSGVENADPRLYHDRQVIITPIERTAQAKVDQASQLWKALGSDVVIMSPQEHDAAFAAVSHLPHMLAFALMNSLASQPEGDKYLKLAGPGFRDFSRIAASDPKMWRDVLIANREELGVQMQHLQRALSALDKLIAEGRADELERLINRASHARANWRLRPGAPA